MQLRLMLRQAVVAGCDRRRYYCRFWLLSNMALFVFNLLPFPPLDGGHIVPAIYEWIRRGLARVRGREVPPPVDTARLMPLTYTMGTILVAMTVLLMIADVVVPISLQ